MTATLACVAVLFVAGAGFAADDVILRSSVNPETAWVGQRVRLAVDVLGADGWAQIRDLSIPEVPGAYVMRTESQGTRLSETINRTAYSGQRYQLSVYCQRPGRVEIEGLPATVAVSTWGAGGGESLRDMATPSVVLECRVPPGAENVRGLISTSSLQSKQSWSSQASEVNLGDAVTRTVTMRAADVSAMAFPPLEHAEIDGLGIYPGEPAVKDRTDRGSLSGERVETVTYVFEKPGEIALPDITLTWWDVRDERLNRVELPGLELTVTGELPTPIPEVGAEAPVEEAPVRFPFVASAVAVILVAVAVVGLRKRFRSWRSARAEAESTYFRQVRTAMRSGDPVAIFDAVLRWLDRLEPDERPARLDRFLDRHGDDEVRSAAEDLAHALASGGGFTDTRTLSSGLGRARRRALKARRAHEKIDILPPLNG